MSANAQDDALLPLREVADLKINEKTANALLRAGIDFIIEIYDRPVTKLLQIPYMGRKGVIEIGEALQKQHNLPFYRGFDEQVLRPAQMVWPPVNSDLYNAHVIPVRGRRDVERAQLNALDNVRRDKRTERRRSMKSTSPQLTG